MGRVRSQGATEYLLILVVVLIVVAAVILFLTTTGPSAIITGTAVKSGDNINFTPSSMMVPASIPSTDWEYAVYRGASRVYPTDTVWAAGTTTLQGGIPVSLLATSVQSGDLLKIRYKAKDVFDTNIS